MTMYQLNLYDFFDKETDPLYLSIQNIKVGETKFIGIHSITLNAYGIYEITCSDLIHESRGSLEECYKYLIENPKQK